MLVRSYFAMGILVCAGFATAAIGGWKGPNFGGGASQSGGVSGGGRGSGIFYSNWHGGK